MSLQEFMTLAEIFATTIFSVKLLHDCIFRNCSPDPLQFAKIIDVIDRKSWILFSLGAFREPFSNRLDVELFFFGF